MSSDLSSKILDHLGLVSGMCDELSISSLIDNLVPQDTTQRNISIGTIVKGLILNGLGFTQRSLYLVPSFFENKPTELLLGAGIKPEHLNDTVIGRALDTIYDFGCTNLFSIISANACKVLNLRSGIGHLDSTSIHLHGNYNSENPPTDATLHLTKGYSRDFHPELNQVVLNLICENKAGIPMHLEALNGNSDDKTSFRKTIEQHIENLQDTQDIKYIIADSALYTSKNIKTISDKILWISRVPESIAECKKIIQSSSKETMTTYDENHKFLPLCSQYSGIKQRWLLVWSSKAYQREKKTLDKNFLKTSQKEKDNFDKLKTKKFACPNDAGKALMDFRKTCKCIEITEDKIITELAYSKKGRPCKNQEPDIKVYKIIGNVSSRINAYQEKLNSKGKFILATNELDNNQLSDEQLFQEYKNQGKVERGFRFIKDPQFMASTLFVKKPERIETLLFIMTLSLLVYASLEYRLRERLEAENQTVPNQLNKPIKNPTMRWIFALFTGVHLLFINKNPILENTENKTIGQQTICLNLNKVHKKIITILGTNYKKYYS